MDGEASLRKMLRNLTIQTQFRVMLGGFPAAVLELSMTSSLHYITRIMPDKRLIGLAAICFFCFLPFASAQSQKTHYRTYSSTHYRSVGSVHNIDQKSRSVRSTVAPNVTGKASGSAAMSRDKQLDQLEHGGHVKPMNARHSASLASTKGMLAPEKHSAPINFAHKELPQTPHYRAPKVR